MSFDATPQPSAMEQAAIAFGHLGTFVKLKGRRLDAIYLRSTQRSYKPGDSRLGRVIDAGPRTEEVDGMRVVVGINVRRLPQTPRDPLGNRATRRKAEGRDYSSLRHHDWRLTIAELRSMEKTP